MAVEGKIKKILFITLTNIGDVVLTLPSLDYLKDKFPDAYFTVLSGPNASVILSKDDRIKENISYNKHAPLREKIALFNRLRKEDFDVIIDLRDTIFRWITKAKYKNPHVIKIPENITHLRLRHLYKTLAAFKEQDKINEIKIPAKSININKAVVESSNMLLGKHRLSLDSEYIVVAPGARSFTKRWLRQGFAEVCNELLKHYSVVLMGDKNDSTVVKDINQHLGERCIDLSGRTSLLEAIEILKNAKLSICNDSAMLQFASYFNIPTLAIFGPTNENKYGPLSDVRAVVRRNTICSPCQGDDCKNNRLCMAKITPQSVIDYAHSLLNGKTFRQQLPFRRILITRTDRLGDVLLSTPVIKNLRDSLPGAYIAMMVKESLVDLLIGNPYLDEVIAFDKSKKHKGIINSLAFIKYLKEKRFDSVLILHPTVRVHIIAFLTGIKERMGYDIKFGFLNTCILKHEKNLGQKHEIEYVLEFLKEIGISYPDKTMYMPIYSEAEAWAERFLKENGLNNSKIVLIHAQASCPSRLWPQEDYNYVAERIINNYKARIVYVGEKRDDKIKEGDGILNFTGKTTISQLASIIKHIDLLISNDSGPVHIAVALGTPVISIFGRNQPGLSPKRWGHSNSKSVFLHKDIGCEVCLAHDCKNGFVCLNAIKPQDVLSCAEKLLNNK